MIRNTECRNGLDQLMACPGCDLLIKRQRVTSGSCSICPRCHCLLAEPKRNNLDQTLALTIAGLILFIPAIFLPIMALKVLGELQEATILTGVSVLYRGGMELLSVLVFLVSVAIPLVKLLFLFYTALSLKLRSGTRYCRWVFRWYHHLDEWGMLEVYMLGIVVAYVKLVDIADVIIGTGLYCFIALLALVSLLSAGLDQQWIWELIGQTQHSKDRYLGNGGYR